MEIKKELAGETLCVKVVGRIDTSTAPQLEEAMKEEIAAQNAITIDFTDVEYVSSAGLRVLLMIQKEMNNKKGSLVLTHVNDDVMEVFEMTGFSNFLTIKE